LPSNKNLRLGHYLATLHDILFLYSFLDWKPP
jgi:hypothetical protein